MDDLGGLIEGEAVGSEVEVGKAKLRDGTECMNVQDWGVRHVGGVIGLVDLVFMEGVTELFGGHATLRGEFEGEGRLV